MKAVVVSQRVDDYPERKETRDALDQNLVRWIRRAGYIVYPIPNSSMTQFEIKEWLDRIGPCGLVLSGGNDVGSVLHRDKLEAALMVYAALNKLPLLGICRGMQMLSCQCGGVLKDVGNHVGTQHRLSGVLEGKANSYHTKALANCPEGYHVLASSEDGNIEAIGHNSLDWEGWMWHPEREMAFDDRDLDRLRRLFG